MIEFETLAINSETNDIHIIFLLKKNIRSYQGILVII